MNKRLIGKKYEEVACKYLEDNGYVIIEQNFATRRGEIDIIARDKEYLCFIEVKFRSSKDKGTGLEAIDKKKQKRIYDTAKYYLYIKKLDEDTMCRFDALSIDGENITIIKNAFP